jgi:4-hydroxyphenylpyruvate dioxygenase
MADTPPLGLLGLEAIHYYVHDLERSRRFYLDMMGFSEVAQSGAELTAGGKQRSVLFEAGGCRVLCSSPEGEGGRAHRYLKKHPDGVGSLVFRVHDIQQTFEALERRGGTVVHDIERFESGSEFLRTFLITTPFGGATFRFVEKSPAYPLYPGLEGVAGLKENPRGFSHFDHITSNFETMAPALLWLEHVMGFERFWEVQFHTDDVQKSSLGSGLRSQVMWDAKSGVKFANNEPYRPHFRESQINIFHEEHRGDGVQHVAIATDNLIQAVRALRERGVVFMPTPATYYDLLPARLTTLGVESIREDIAELRELGILVDGDGPGSYLLQIFLKESKGLYQDDQAGPFFYELIQRNGDEGFGAGNFRALFESIEREQQAKSAL